MPAYEVTIRDAIEGKINADKVGYVFTDVDVESTHLPDENLKDLTDKPRLRITVQAYDEDRQLRAMKYRVEIPIHFEVIHKVSAQPTQQKTDVDSLLELVQQIKATCRDDELAAGFSFVRIEQERDEEELPYNREQLRTQGVFLNAFDVVYAYIIQ